MKRLTDEQIDKIQLGVVYSSKNYDVLTPCLDAQLAQDKAECEARIREIFNEIEGNWSWMINPLLGEDFSKRASIGYNQWKNIKAKYLGKGEADARKE